MNGPAPTTTAAGRHAGTRLSMEPATKRVLLIEDDDAVADFYRASLQNANYAIYRARDGEEAVSLVDSISFDAIVSDLEMPGIHGIELLKSMRGHDRDVPIVILQGYYFARPNAVIRSGDRRLLAQRSEKLLRWSRPSRGDTSSRTKPA